MSLKTNKIFAAFLIAGIIAMISGFAAQAIIPSHKAPKDTGMKTDIAATSAAPKKATSAEPIADLMAAADIIEGENLARPCVMCHSFKKGAANKIGPNLFKIVGRNKASVSDFSYSKGMKAVGGKWDEESLNQFLWKPRKMVKGTKMVYSGLKKAKDRAALIKWLKTHK